MISQLSQAIASVGILTPASRVVANESFFFNGEQLFPVGLEVGLCRGQAIILAPAAPEKPVAFTGGEYRLVLLRSATVEEFGGWTGAPRAAANDLSCVEGLRLEDGALKGVDVKSVFIDQ